MPLRQLRELARERGIFRYARMRKAQLQAALRELADEGAPPSAATPPPDAETVAALDAAAPELPASYGQDRIVLMPYDPGQVYAYWELTEERQARARPAGGGRLALLLFDTTHLDSPEQTPSNVREYPGDEAAGAQYLAVPLGDHDYAVELGYRCRDGRWLPLTRSAPVRVPPAAPSAGGAAERTLTLDWTQPLSGALLAELASPQRSPVAEATPASVLTASPEAPQDPARRPQETAPSSPGGETG